MTASHFQTCFISAPLAVDTTPLRLALQERGIHWSDARSAKAKGSTLDTIESAIALGNDQSSPNLISDAIAFHLDFIRLCQICKREFSELTPNT